MENLATLSRLAFLLFFGGFILFHGLKLYRQWWQYSRSAISKLIACGLLIIVHPLLRIVESAPLWLDLVSTVAQHLAVLLGYLAGDQILNSRRREPLIRQPILWATLGLSLLTAALMFLSRTNRGSFTDSHSSEPASTLPTTPSTT